MNVNRRQRPQQPPAFNVPLILSASAAVAGVLAGLQRPPVPREDATTCAACSGSGYIECLCTRWANDSSHKMTKGCGSCAGSGRTKCTRCGGGGTMAHAVGKQTIKAKSNHLYLRGEQLRWGRRSVFARE